jgi:hypothetical protein
MPSHLKKVHRIHYSDDAVRYLMGMKTTVMKSAMPFAGSMQGGAARIYQSTSHSNSIFGGNNRSFTPYHTNKSHSVVSLALGAGSNKINKSDEYSLPLTEFFNSIPYYINTITLSPKLFSPLKLSKLQMPITI